MTSLSIQALPEEVLSYIFRSLGACPTLKVATVCKEWKRVIDDEYLWQFYCTLNGYTLEDTWKLTFKNHYLTRWGVVGTHLIVEGLRVSYSPTSDSQNCSAFLERPQKSGSRSYHFRYFAVAGVDGDRAIGVRVIDQEPLNVQMADLFVGCQDTSHALSWQHGYITRGTVVDGDVLKYGANDVVRMDVNVDTATISWFVNGKHSTTITDEKLSAGVYVQVTLYRTGDWIDILRDAERA